MRPLLAFALVSLCWHTAAAEPDCAAQQQSFNAWLALAAADRDAGAVLGPPRLSLATLPLRRGKGPDAAAMVLVVEKGGVRDGEGALMPLQRVGTVIELNRNIEWLRKDKHAYARGIIVAPQADAPAASVRAAVTAALKSGERTWLLFHPTDAHISAPAASKIGEQLDSGNVETLVKILTREFGPCAPLMDMMRDISESATARLDDLVTKPAAALAKCKCKPSAATLQAILWTLAFRDLAVVVEVKKPFDAPDGTWAEVAAAVVKTL